MFFWQKDLGVSAKLGLTHVNFGKNGATATSLTHQTLHTI
jgi:hypothetical protein